MAKFVLEVVLQCAMPDALSAMKFGNGTLLICRKDVRALGAASIPNTTTAPYWKPCFGWLDLPTEFGPWDIIHRRFRRRCQEGVCDDGWFARLTADLELDLDTVMVDGTFVKVHQHGTGAPKGDAGTTPDDSRAVQAVGVSRGGLTTKIVAMVDKGGQLAGFVLTPGNGHEPHSLPDLLEGVPTHELIADKAYDTNDTLALLRAREIAAVIPSRANRKAPRWCDPGVYGMRHLVANRFAALKEFRGVATRYCQRALMYGAAQPDVGICGLARGGVRAAGRGPSGRQSPAGTVKRYSPWCHQALGGGHMHRHSGASRNPGRVVIFTVIPDPQPSFRRKPESSAALREPSLRRSGPQPSLPPPPTVIPAQAGIWCNIANHPYAEAAPNRHSGASRNLWRAVTFTITPSPPTVIPAQAGIYACRLHYRLSQPSFRRKPESMYAASIADSLNRHSAASRNPGRVVIFTVITVSPNRHSGASRNLCPPAYHLLPQPSFRLSPESRACSHMHRHSGAPAPGLDCPATIDIPASPFAIIMAWSI